MALRWTFLVRVDCEHAEAERWAGSKANHSRQSHQDNDQPCTRHEASTSGTVPMKVG